MAISIGTLSIPQTSVSAESSLYYYPKDESSWGSIDDQVNPIASIQRSQDIAGNYHLSWGVAAMQADTFADYVSNSVSSDDSITVAVVDTGVSADHSLLQGRVLEGGFDYVNDDWDTADDNGHGTHVAGIIADCTQGLS